MNRFVSRLRSVLSSFYHLPERVLHPLRRRRILAALPEYAAPASVLFVCHGNINRSAYAAAAFRRLLTQVDRPGVRVASAGFIGPGRPASDLARDLAARRGLDLSQHLSRLLDPAELRSATLIIVMDERQQAEICRIAQRGRDSVIVLGDLDPRPIRRRSVLDPYGHGERVFEEVFTRIDRCLAQLARAVMADAGDSDPASGESESGRSRR